MDDSSVYIAFRPTLIRSQVPSQGQPGNMNDGIRRSIAIGLLSQIDELYLQILCDLPIDAKLVGAFWLVIGLIILIVKTKFFSVRTPKLDFTSKD